MWGWLQAIVQGIVQPLIEAWQQYQHGRVAQQRDDTKATLEVERAMDQAVEDDCRTRRVVSADELRQRIERAKAARDARAQGERE